MGKQIDGYGLVDRYTVDYGTDGDYTYGLSTDCSSDPQRHFAVRHEHKGSRADRRVCVRCQ